VTNNDPKDFQRLTDFFDVIVVDAPCSGSGLFRRDAAAIKEWSPQNVELCCQRQQRILEDVLPALKEDGMLIYSTCSYSADENEEIVDWLIDDMSMQSRQLAVENDWNIVETVSAKQGYGYRFYPDRVRGEGFFIAAMRKCNSSGTYYAGKNKFEKIERTRHGVFLQDWIKQPEQFQYIKFKNEILAMPHAWKEEHFSMLSSMHIKKAGIKIGEVMNGTLVPDHQLAVSGIVNDRVPRIDLSKEEAIKYLKKETIQTEVEGKGWMLVCYQGLPLGWIKALPNRINNYYPKEWRILKQG
jgi:NOL1/NOP2/fmu family ribosome biogenesis protein